MIFLLSVHKRIRTIPMNQYVETALRKLGHEVHVFNHDTGSLIDRANNKINRPKFIQNKNKALLKLIDQVKPDVFFAIYGKTHAVETIEAIKKKGILTLCWWLNDPFALGTAFESAKAYDYYFTNSKGTHQQYRDFGIKNIQFLPVGIEPTIHQPLANLTKKHDILFAGDWHPIREQVLNKLTSKYNLAIMGPWKRKIPKDSPLHPFIIQNSFFTPQEMVKGFNQSKIIFNLHTWFEKWNYGINPRLFEASGCKAFQIVDFKEEIPELFALEKEVITYNTLDQIDELIDFYLAHDHQREEIAANAYKKCLQQHTYEHRMQEVMAVCSL